MTTETRRVVRVFLGSPGDLSDERRTARAVVDEINDLLARRLGCHVELVRWENVVSSYGRPQGTINKDLERCELFIGLMWKRWGTPPSVESKYTSGFHEEYSISADSFERTGRPKISLYFKTVEQAQIEDPGQELARVLKFKQEIIDSKTILYEVFDTLDDLSMKLRRCITQHLFNLQDEEEANGTQLSQALPVTDAAIEAVPLGAAEQKLLPDEAIDFLRSFLETVEKGAGESFLPNIDVARYRLLGCVLSQHGNSNETLAVHDANLLFDVREQLSLSPGEYIALIESGCVNLRTENAPLWYWVQAITSFEDLPFGWMSATGPEARRLGALNSMQLLGAPINSPTADVRRSIVATWLGESSDAQLKVAALTYLGGWGKAEDLPAIRAEYERGSYQTVGIAADALLRVTFREKGAEALKLLYELDLGSPNADTVDLLFSGSENVSNEMFIEGLALKSSHIRLIAMRALRRRKSLTVSQAEALIDDASASAEVRYEALLALEEIGQPRSLEQARACLVTPKRGLGLAPFGVPQDTEGEEFYARLRNWQLGKLSDDALEKLEARTFFDWQPLFVRAEKNYEAHASRLRAAAADEFQSEFQEALSRVSNQAGSSSAEAIKPMEKEITKKALRGALDVISRRGGASDLQVVRDVVKNGTVALEKGELDFLRRYGEWEDISLIIDAVQRPNPNALGLLAIAERRYDREAGEAIYAIARGRLGDLLQEEVPTFILEQVLVAAPPADFAQLKESDLDSFLNATGVRVRKLTVLKCLLGLPTLRIAALLASYMKRERRFYNVIHWLDFGISVPRNIMIEAVARLLKVADKGAA